MGSRLKFGFFSKYSANSYESLLTDPLNTLTRAIEKITGREADQRLLAQIIERYRFKRMTGRKPGEESRDSFIRKGIAGDWVNYFTREAAEIFDRHAGDVLVMLGYEKDRSWVSRLSTMPAKSA